MTGSYDDRQLDVPLRTCATCGKAFYMRAVICAQCGPGVRTVQQVPESRLDAQGNLIDGP